MTRLDNSGNLKQVVNTGSIVSLLPPTAAVSPTQHPINLMGQGSVGEPTTSRFSPWLMPIVYPLGARLILPGYFSHIDIAGQEHLPRSGPVILAPTHRSRWDALVVPYATGHRVTGRHLRFMVTADEMVGLQGWLIRRVGGFAINTRNPKASSLRHGIDILQQGEALVIFPEGDIYRQQQIQPLKSGLAWLALHAEASYRGLGIKIVPISLHYSDPMVPWRSRVSLRIGSPLEVANYNLNEPKQSTRQLTAQLQQALEKLAASHCAPKPKY